MSGWIDSLIESARSSGWRDSGRRCPIHGTMLLERGGVVEDCVTCDGVVDARHHAESIRERAELAVRYSDPLSDADFARELKKLFDFTGNGSKFTRDEVRSWYAFFRHSPGGLVVRGMRALAASKDFLSPRNLARHAGIVGVDFDGLDSVQVVKKIT